MTATEETSIDTAIVTISSERDGIHTLKESHKNQLNAFPGEQHCNTFLPTGFHEQLRLPNRKSYANNTNLIGLLQYERQKIRPITLSVVYVR